MELIDLKAALRQETGKGKARVVRGKGKVPAIVYGAEIDPVMLTIGAKEFDKIVRENGTQGVFLKLAVDGDDKPFRTVVLKEIQMDAFQKEFLHVDFNEINMENKLTVSVPVTAVGIAKGVKVDGGNLQIIRRELDIICKPVDVPDEIVIDVSEMEIGDAIHVEDIKVDEKIEIPHEVNFTVITLIPPTTDSSSSEDEDEMLDDQVAEDTETKETSEDDS